MNNKPVVHIVDDDDSVRDSLRMFFNSFDINTRLYHSAQDFLDNHDCIEPCCVLLDVRMPHIGGLQLLELLNQKHINVPVIIMTGFGEVSTAVHAMKAGALDFIEKPFNHEQLLNTIYQSIEIHKKRHGGASQSTDYLALLATLSEREREVFDLVTAGLINKIIASKLGISTRTVEAHRARIMEKLQADSLTDLVRISVNVEKQRET